MHLVSPHPRTRCNCIMSMKLSRGLVKGGDVQLLGLDLDLRAWISNRLQVMVMLMLLASEDF